MPPKRPSSAVIDLTDDTIEEIVEAYSPNSTSSSSDLAILRTLVHNSLTEPIPLPITSSPITLRAGNQNSKLSRNLNASDEVTVVKTVKLPAGKGKKTQKLLEPILVVDPPAQTSPTTTVTTDKKCPVCFDIIQRPSVTLCGHVYCTECIGAAVNTTKQCPICRKKLTKRGFHPLYL